MRDEERIREALGFIPAHDRETWVRMAMAIKSELGDAGFDIWDEWSQQDESYSRNDARDVWKSVNETGKVTIGTLFHEAKARGWKNDGAHPVPTPEEMAARRQDRAEREAREHADDERKRTEAAGKAVALWKAATPADPEHSYLARKRVPPVATLRQIDARKALAILGYLAKSGGESLGEGRWLVAPIKVGDRITSVELIDEAGRKSALYGGVKAGGYWAAQPLPDGDGEGLTLQIGEGIATVLSAMEATGHASVAALTCGNLKAVAKTMRDRYPKATLVILADLGNGQDDAHKAALAVGARLAIPDFGNDAGEDATDFNDMYVHRGPDAVRACIEAAKAPEAASPATPSLTLTRGDSIRPEPIDWIWDGWLARGKLHILAGAAGTGKTTLALALAATVTTGGRWPDGTRCEAGDVVIWSGEDDPADTLVPRLYAMGADLKRMHFVGCVHGGQVRRAFDPATDVGLLAARFQEIGKVMLTIVDPIVSAVAADSHRNAEVRRGLQPLVDLAIEMGTALLGITHYSKGTTGRDPLDRVTGSLAFGALARIVMGTAKPTEADASRRLVRTKSNIGPDGGGYEYDIEQAQVHTYPGIFASRVLWGEALEGKARELLAEVETEPEAEGAEERTEIAEASEWLRDRLHLGSVEAREIFKEGAAHGYQKRTMQRARTKLGATSKRDGFGKGSRVLWALPDSAIDDKKRIGDRISEQENRSSMGEPVTYESSTEEF